MLILGLTGGSGAGKSTVLRVWADLGAYTIDADVTYHRLLREDAALLGALRARFPEAFASGGLDRKALGRIVYASKERQRELEQITHGAVITDVERELEAARLNGYKTAAVEALYLLENPLRQRFAAVLGVIAPYEARLGRLMTRDGLSRDYAAARLAAQPDDAYYRARCDMILENDSGTAELARRAREMFMQFTVHNSQFTIAESPSTTE